MNICRSIIESGQKITPNPRMGLQAFSSSLQILRKGKQEARKNKYPSIRTSCSAFRQS
jgi:hypothetical protein